MILNAIQRAYAQLEQRRYDYIYIALDIHGTCADSDYHNTVSQSLYPAAVDALRVISNLPEVKIILYSCCHPDSYEPYMKIFADHGIKVAYFNSNPEIENTKTGCFDSKFYFSLMFDDKAGFDPIEWPHVRDAFILHRYHNKQVRAIESGVQIPDVSALAKAARHYVSLARDRQPVMSDLIDAEDRLSELLNQFDPQGT